MPPRLGRTRNTPEPGSCRAKRLCWVVFGTAVLGQPFEFFSWKVVVYALLSLTVIRMLPIFLSLTGSGETIENRVFLGWFGPRGLASIVFCIIVLNANVPGAGEMAMVLVCTLFLSAFAHGLTANPFAEAFAKRLSAN